MLNAYGVVIRAVAGGGMDESCARVVGDVVAGQHGDVVVPLAVGAVGIAQRMGTDEIFQFLNRDIT